MARATGKDVVLDLMDMVQTLQASQEQQDEIIGRITLRLDLMVERGRAIWQRLDGLTGRMDDVTGRMDDMTVRMNEMTVRMNEMTGRMNEMTGRMNEMTGRMNDMTGQLGFLTEQFREQVEDQTLLRTQFNELAGHGRVYADGLKRLASGLSRLATDGDERFSRLESRVLKLEKKTG